MTNTPFNFVFFQVKKNGAYFRNPGNQRGLGGREREREREGEKEK